MISAFDVYPNPAVPVPEHRWIGTYPRSMLLHQTAENSLRIKILNIQEVSSDLFKSSLASQ